MAGSGGHLRSALKESGLGPETFGGDTEGFVAMEGSEGQLRSALKRAVLGPEPFDGDTEREFVRHMARTTLLQTKIIMLVFIIAGIGKVLLVWRCGKNFLDSFYSHDCTLAALPVVAVVFLTFLEKLYIRYARLFRLILMVSFSSTSFVAHFTGKRPEVLYIAYIISLHAVLRPTYTSFLIACLVTWPGICFPFDLVMTGQERRDHTAQYFGLINVIMIMLMVCMGFITYGVEKFCRCEFATAQEEKHKVEEVKRTVDNLYYFLSNALPTSILQRKLAEPERIIADYYPECSILTADICGFTKWSTRCTADRIVEVLNTLYSLLDDLSVTDDVVQKVTTAGDSYIAVAGIECNLAPAEAAYAIMCYAFAMLTCVQVVNKEFNESLSIRAGVDAGPAYYGVLGRLRLGCSVWGEAYTQANQLEQSGIPSAIHGSARLHNKLEGCQEIHSGEWIVQQKKVASTADVKKVGSTTDFCKGTNRGTLSPRRTHQSPYRQKTSPTASPKTSPPTKKRPQLTIAPSPSLNDASNPTSPRSLPTSSTAPGLAPSVMPIPNLVANDSPRSPETAPALAAPQPVSASTATAIAASSSNSFSPRHKPRTDSLGDAARFHRQQIIRAKSGDHINNPRTPTIDARLGSLWDPNVNGGMAGRSSEMLTVTGQRMMPRRASGLMKNTEIDADGSPVIRLAISPSKSMGHSGSPFRHHTSPNARNLDSPTRDPRFIEGMGHAAIARKAISTTGRSGSGGSLSGLEDTHNWRDRNNSIDTRNNDQGSGWSPSRPGALHSPHPELMSFRFGLDGQDEGDAPGGGSLDELAVTYIFSKMDIFITQVTEVITETTGESTERPTPRTSRESPGPTNPVQNNPLVSPVAKHSVKFNKEIDRHLPFHKVHSFSTKGAAVQSAAEAILPGTTGTSVNREETVDNASRLSLSTVKPKGRSRAISLRVGEPPRSLGESKEEDKACSTSYLNLAVPSRKEKAVSAANAKRDVRSLLGGAADFSKPLPTLRSGQVKPFTDLLSTAQTPSPNDRPEAEFQSNGRDIMGIVRDLTGGSRTPVSELQGQRDRPALTVTTQESHTILSLTPGLSSWQGTPRHGTSSLPPRHAPPSRRGSALDYHGSATPVTPQDPLPSGSGQKSLQLQEEVNPRRSSAGGSASSEADYAISGSAASAVHGGTTTWGADAVFNEETTLTAMWKACVMFAMLQTAAFAGASAGFYDQWYILASMALGQILISFFLLLGPTPWTVITKVWAILIIQWIMHNVYLFVIIYHISTDENKDSTLSRTLFFVELSFSSQMVLFGSFLLDRSRILPMYGLFVATGAAWVGGAIYMTIVTTDNDAQCVALSPIIPAVCVLVVTKLICMWFMNHQAEKLQESEQSIRYQSWQLQQYGDARKSLMYAIFPKHVVNSLIVDPMARCVEVFPSVSVAFIQLVGRKPSKVTHTYEVLDNFFKTLDDICETLPQVEKIKSINEMYMVASGLNKQCTSYEQVTSMMRFLCRAIDTIDSEDYKLTIGVNSGCAVGAVIGVVNFIYDIFGDTINLASRMLTTAPDEDRSVVHVSSEVVKLLSEHNCHLCTEVSYKVERMKDVKDVKGKGFLQTYALCLQRREPSTLIACEKKSGRSGSSHTDVPFQGENLSSCR